MSCPDKHMRCSFVPAKDGEGKGTLSGMQCTKSLAKPQMKVLSMGAPVMKGVDCFSGVNSGTPLVSIISFF